MVLTASRVVGANTARRQWGITLSEVDAWLGENSFITGLLVLEGRSKTLKKPAAQRVSDVKSVLV